MEILQNDRLRVVVSDKGAEMQHLQKADGTELLWQGDAAYWGKRSPVLFPIVGRLWDGAMRAEGAEWRVPKHGFVSTARWACVSADGERVAYVYETTDEDLRCFPWRARVEVAYRLYNNKVYADFSVENLSPGTMYFQMGGHPGFALPGWCEEEAVDGYLRLEGRPESVLRASTQGCTEPARFGFPLTDDGLVPLSQATFENEALIFDRKQVSAVELLDKTRRRLVRVESDAPVWLFWSPQGQHAPFVCVEPWYGLCDAQGFDGPVEARPYINALESGGVWRGGYAIEVLI